MRSGSAMPKSNLKLKRARSQAEVFGVRQRDAQAAEIVRAEGGVEGGAVIQEAPGEPFIVRVGVFLFGEDRAGMTVQPGLDDFVIPIGALDQANGERRAAFGSKGEDPVEVVVGGFQVGLDDDAEVRPGGEIGIERDPLEQAVGDLVKVPLLEIEIDEGAEFLRAQEQGTHAAQQPLHAAVGIDRIEQVIHGGKFERDVGAGDGAVRTPIENRPRFPSGGLGRKKFDEIGVALRVGRRFGGVDCRLAEKVDGEAEAPGPKAFSIYHGHGAHPGPR